jgi:transposase-like protein
MKDFSSHPRRRFTADERAKFVALCRQSDLTQSAFARQHGIKLGTLQQWLCRLKPQPASARPRFQELTVPLSSSKWAAQIRLSQEITIQLDAQAAGQLITQLLGSLRQSC